MEDNLVREYRSGRYEQGVRFAQPFATSSGLERSVIEAYVNDRAEGAMARMRVLDPNAHVEDLINKFLKARGDVKFAVNPY